MSNTHDDLCVWWDNVGKEPHDYSCTCGYLHRECLRLSRERNELMDCLVGARTQPGIPDGLRLVPIEPTDTQKACGFECGEFSQLMEEFWPEGHRWPYSCRGAAQFVTGIYRAMVEAAPEKTNKET